MKNLVYKKKTWYIKKQTWVYKKKLEFIKSRSNPLFLCTTRYSHQNVQHKIPFFWGSFDDLSCDFRSDRIETGQRKITENIDIQIRRQ